MPGRDVVDELAAHACALTIPRGQQTNTRRKMAEMGLFTVKDGKIVREEFFYVTG